jgi:hypothetical protein
MGALFFPLDDKLVNIIVARADLLLKAVTANKAYPLAQTTPSVALISDTWRRPAPAHRQTQ